MNWKPGLVASFIVSGAITILHQLLATGGRYYVERVNWIAVNRMPYEEAQKYLLERSTFSRWQSLSNAIHYPEFWYSGAVEWAFLCVLGLLSCWLYARLSRA